MSPLCRYCSAILPIFSLKIETLCHSVLSCFSPLCLSFHVSDVARLKLTFWPPEPNRKTCGSFPNRPTNITLLTHSFPQSDIIFLRSELSLCLTFAYALHRPPRQEARRLLL